MSAPLFVDDVLFYQRLLKSSGYYKDTLDGDWGSKTDDADRRFLADAANLKASLGEFDARTEGNILTLHIKAQERARRFMTEVSGGPFRCRIISGTRSYKQQDALFAQGRDGNPGPRVTNARGGHSNHNFGIAWDVGVFDNSGKYLTGATAAEVKAYKDVAAGVDLMDLEWGGDWTSFIDRPHYQMKTGRKTSEVRALFESGQPYT
jgi:peptidoglycan LD-endopeptidase CwlK